MPEQEWIATELPGFKLRFAREKDVPLILEFIRELAKYEKLAHEVVATEKLLRENLFGDQPRAETILGFEGVEAVGFALFFHNFSTFLGKPGIYLEDLYVKPAMRGNGYGSVLLNFLARLAVQRKCGRLEWSVLDWNESAIGFYRQLGAVAMDDWTVYRLAGRPLNDLAEKWKSGSKDRI